MPDNPQYPFLSVSFMPCLTFSALMSGGGTQKRHIMQSGPRQVPAEPSRGDACPLSNGHHFSFAFPTDVIITPPLLQSGIRSQHAPSPVRSDQLFAKSVP
jgi:hypothetical protein